MALLFSLILLTFFLITYLIYYFFITRANKKAGTYLENIKQVLKNCRDDPLAVSIIISVYDEEKVIKRKLEDIANLNYPKEKLEVLVIDDDSNDRTYEIAQSSIKQLNINGRIIRNKKRIGLNASLNLAIQNASYDIICITDADVTLEKDALKNSLCLLNSDDEIGGVTGNIVPQFGSTNLVTNLEEAYREISNRAMLVESFLHSTFPGSGVLTVFKKRALPDLIPESYGSTDGNISMNIIKAGYRFLYQPYSDVYEPMPEDFGQHRLQKIRRAKRLIQVIIHNNHMLFNGKVGKFGTTIFPIKYAMHVVCPIFLLTGIFSLLIFVLTSNNPILYLLSSLLFFITFLLMVIPNKMGAFLVSFVLHQYYLIRGLFSSFSKNVFWNKIQRK